MKELSLMDRLRDRRVDRSTELNTSILADSVLMNLKRMLNTRQGLALTVPDYGLPDMTDMVHLFPEAVDICRRSIRQSIEKYEPRLKNVVVTSAIDGDEPFNLRFEIRAQLVTEKEARPIQFFTTLDASGQADVRR